MYRLCYTNQAMIDAKKIAASGLKQQVMQLLEVLIKNPYEHHLPYETLVGDFSKAISRRINIQHRLVYQVLEQENVVKIIRMWSHYDD